MGNYAIRMTNMGGGGVKRGFFCKKLKKIQPQPPPLTQKIEYRVFSYTTYRKSDFYEKDEDVLLIRE